MVGDFWLEGRNEKGQRVPGDRGGETRGVVVVDFVRMVFGCLIGGNCTTGGGRVSQVSSHWKGIRLESVGEESGTHRLVETTQVVVTCEDGRTLIDGGTGAQKKEGGTGEVE